MSSPFTHSFSLCLRAFPLSLVHTLTFSLSHTQIQLVNNLNALDSMMNNLTEAMNVADPMSNPLSFDSIQPGLVCCAYSDEQWYRVLVLEPPGTASTSDEVSIDKK